MPYHLLEISQFSGGAANFQLARGRNRGDSGGVVAAIFQLSQAFNDHGHNFFRADVADNSAHATQLLGDFTSVTRQRFVFGQTRVGV